MGAASAKRAFLSIAPVEGVEGESAVDLAVAVVVHDQPGGGLGVAFLLSSRAASWASAASGQTTSRICRPRLLECLGVVVGGEVEQVAFGLLDPVRRRGRRAARSGRGGWPRPARHGPGRRPARCGSGRGARGPGRAASPGALRPGWCGWCRRASSRSRSRRCWRRARSGRRGPAARAFEFGQLGLGGLDLGDGGGGLGGVHRPHRDLGDIAELIADTSDRPGDRVRLVGDRCHGPIQAPATDTGPGRNPLWIRGSGTSAVDGKWSVPTRFWRRASPRRGCGGLDKLDQRWAAGAFDAVVARPPTTAGPQPAHRRQPDSQPAFGPRRGCQPAHRTAAKAPRLDSPGEGQTLGYRVAAGTPTLPQRRAQRAFVETSGAAGLDKLDQRLGASQCTARPQPDRCAARVTITS